MTFKTFLIAVLAAAAFLGAAVIAVPPTSKRASAPVGTVLPMG